MYRDTITIFNRYHTPNGDVWYPTVLTGVDLNIDHAAIMAKYGENAQDNSKLHIRLDGNKVGGKIYVTPKEYQALLSTTGYITFNPGADFDFYYEGSWTTTVNDNDYLDGFYNYMNKRYDHVFAITAVAKYSVIPHFEILGR